MKKLFHKILLPVDLSEATTGIVERAADMAHQYGCSLHLVHVSPVRWLPMANISKEGVIEEMEYPRIEELVFQMTRLADHVRDLYDGEIEIDFTLRKGKWDNEVIDVARQGRFDLVVAGQYENSHGKHRLLVDTDRIAMETNVPVISVPPQRRLTRIYSVLLPVTNFLPVRKLIYAVYIASTDKASLKLVGVTSEGAYARTEYFLKKSYELIHDSTAVYVGLAITKSQNVAAVVNDIANEESTDLVVVNPVEQTRLPGLFFPSSGKALQKYTSAPVLTVNPL